MFVAKLVKIDKVFFSPALHKEIGLHTDINVVKHCLSAGGPKTINLISLHYYSISDTVTSYNILLNTLQEYNMETTVFL